MNFSSAKKYLLLVSLLFKVIVSSQLSAQTNNPEKIYIHTDRNTYRSGETIFFKAYIYSRFSPDDIATVMEMDLVAKEKTVLPVHKYIVGKGIAYGAVTIPDSLPGGAYYLRAWLVRNNKQEPSGAVYRPLYLYSPSAGSAEHGKSNETRDTATAIEFYPGSVGLIRGVPNTVFYKIDPGTTKPLKHYRVVSGNNEPIAVIEPVWKGIGNFVFQPNDTGIYKITDGGTAVGNADIPLPAFSDQAVSIDCADNGKSIMFTVYKPRSLQTADSLRVIGIMDGILIFEKKIPDNKTVFSANIPTDELPAAVMDIAVLKGKNELLGYRSVFVNANGSFPSVELTMDSLHTGDTLQNVFTLQFKDTTAANCSVSVIDAEKDIIVDDGGIIPALLLPGVQMEREPDFSLIPTVNITTRMNLLAGTDPFTRKRIQSFLQNQSPETNEPDSGYLHVSGKILDKKTGKPIQKGTIKFILYNQPVGTDIAETTIKPGGIFQLDHIVYEGETKLSYEVDGQEKNDLLIIFDSTQQKVVTDKTFASPLLFRLAERATALQKNFPVKKIATDTVKNFGTSTLKEVVVTKKIGRPVDLVNEKYATGIFSNNIASKIVDLVNDPPTHNAGNIFDYLMGRINGLMIGRKGANNYELSTTRGYTMTGGLAKIRVYLNEHETTIDDIAGVPLVDVALVKYFPPGNGQLPGIGLAGILAIYTRKLDDALVNKTVAQPGFTSAFRFRGFEPFTAFDPAGKNDQTKPVLYWNPDVFFDRATPSFTFRFAGNGSARKYYLKVEGFTVDGKLIHFEKLIQ